ncbi:hypothetical protein CBR_g51641 [Chara braunii]|uniref:Dynein heavy chain AAA 5 extension domain-containing protein n=1 Tax=Chara braunii TaxID=69332 RepID=A0A388M924_CHABU|nr:hypothetical protein CBR_g51641 [Chara braunii]|eukprot:GBG90983.1 hypothetical protein CBR_g51641 [Chara braunii]
MSETMNMMFEVQDLAAASPATVSRCGMVHVEPSMIGWLPLKTSWVETLPGSLHGNGPAMSMIESMFTWMIDPCMRFIRRECKETIPTSDINLPQSLMNVYESLLDDFKLVDMAAAAAMPTMVGNGGARGSHGGRAEGDQLHQETSTTQRNSSPPVIGTGKPQKQATSNGQQSFSIPTGKELDAYIQCMFAFALVWTIGGTIDLEGRLLFDQFFRSLLAHEENLGFNLGPGIDLQVPNWKFTLPFPEDGSVYDYFFDKEAIDWRPWFRILNNASPNTEAAFHEILVPTTDTARYSFLLDVMITHGKHILFGGSTGTGKTLYIKNKLSAGLDRSLYTNVCSTFSAQTDANQIQDIIDSKMDKRKKGVYGPPFGTCCVIFIDDVNMPAPDAYGSQPPVELLRQWMDHGGWYDREENAFRHLVDIQFVAAMAPPGGGRNSITARYLHHFHLISISDFDDKNLSAIFETVMDWWCQRSRLIHEVRSMFQA